MSQENTYWTRLNEKWRLAVKKIAPDHAVNADELLQKVPNLFPATDRNQQQNPFMGEFLLRTRKMTFAERTVCLRASQCVHEAIRNEIHRIRPDFLKGTNLP